MIRTINTSFGLRSFLVCGTRGCGNEAQIDMWDNRDDAVNFAMPSGWESRIERTMRTWRPVRIDVCPACVALGL